MHNRFPVRPSPKLEESFVGFVLRVAKVNGYHKLTSIFRVVGVAFLITDFEVCSKKFKVLVNKLAPFLLLKPEELFTQFSETQSLYVDKDRSVKKINSHEPHICISCFQTGDTYLKQNWQLAHNTFCEIHCTKLQSICPCCKTRFTWNTDLFDGCAKCGLRWSDVSILSVSDIPLYQVMANKLKGEQRDSYLRHLYKALIVCARPLDYLSISLKQCPCMLRPEPITHFGIIRS